MVTGPQSPNDIMTYLMANVIILIFENSGRYTKPKEQANILDEDTKSRLLEKIADSYLPLQGNFLCDVRNCGAISSYRRSIYEVPKDKSERKKWLDAVKKYQGRLNRFCLLYTSPSPRDKRQSRMPSSA